MDALIRFSKKPLAVFLPRYSHVRTMKNHKAVKRLFGIPPHLGKSLTQKLEEASYKDPDIHYKVNIGLPLVIEKPLVSDRLNHVKNIRKNLNFEKQSRECKLNLNLSDVTNDWMQESAPQHIKLAADHYGIFQDLFGDAYFYPTVNLDVAFDHEGSFIPVYRGNSIKPIQAQSKPLITFDADTSSLWTLILTNPDGNLLKENSEYIHWFLSNIPGNNLNQGEVGVEYIQPFPAYGSGFQRLVFILYKQSKKIDFPFKLTSKDVDFEKRTFNTFDFYQKHQDFLTPAGLAFCQADWDISVSNFFHTVMDQEEPVYEYDFDPPYHPKQKMYPLRQPFNLYMDRYRDPKAIAKEYLLRKLKDRHPFVAPKVPPKFPNIYDVRHDIDEKLFGTIPSWLKREKIKRRLGWGRINDY